MLKSNYHTNKDKSAKIIRQYLIKRFVKDKLKFITRYTTYILFLTSFNVVNVKLPFASKYVIYKISYSCVMYSI